MCYVLFIKCICLLNNKVTVALLNENNMSMSFFYANAGYMSFLNLKV